MAAGVGVIEEECVSVLGPAMSEREGALVLPVNRHALVCHNLPITQLVSLEAGERVLLSASQDGIVKAWK